MFKRNVLAAVKCGAALRRARKACGFSLRELSVRTGVAASALARLERGETLPSLQMLCRICHALSTDASFIVHDISVTDFEQKTCFRRASGRA